MKIKRQTGNRLVLAGVPGGFGWMVFATLLGAAFIGILGTVAFRLYAANGLVWPHLAMALGMLIGGGIFAMGAVTLAVGRLRLELDLVTKKGSYHVRSPIVEAGKPCAFDLAHVHSVTLERFEESRPSGQPGTSTATVLRSRLRVTKPRRAIVLAETQNGQDERVERVAAEVAGFLDVEITRSER